MEKLLKYSKVATIRKKQLEQTEMMRKEYIDQNNKMAEMMELDRLKELKFNEDQKAVKKEQLKLGALVINDQIKDKEIEFDTWNSDKKLSDHIGICITIT